MILTYLNMSVQISQKCSVSAVVFPKKVDIVIVGAGPVGLAMAALLSRFSVRAIVFDRLPSINRDPRAIALDNEALRILVACGLDLEDLELVRIPRVRYRSPLFGEFARMNTGETKDGLPALVTFFQPDLENELEKKIVDSEFVELYRGVEAQVVHNDAERSVVRVTRVESDQSQDIEARFVIAADGAASPIRQALGIAFTGISYAQDWLIVDALHVPEQIEDITFYCDPLRPTPHMPAPGDRQRWEFMLHPGESQDVFLQDQTIEALIAPWTSFENIRVERKAVYRFHARLADRFLSDSVILIGDAAHVTPPFAGQGLVSGLRDVANLGWRLANILAGRLNLSTLHTYDTERRPHARKMIRLAQTLGAVIMPTNRLKAFLVHGLARFITLLPLVRRLVTDMKMKPQNVFEEGLFDKSFKGPFPAGSHLPQWSVVVKNSVLALSDEVLGNAFVLIGFDVDPAACLPQSILAQWIGIGGKIMIFARSDLAGREMFRVDAIFADEACAPPVGACAVVRPDKLVMCSAQRGRMTECVSSALSVL
jgi:3-(3-hydroxy-phenyl)propionate hydroxylase